MDIHGYYVTVTSYIEKYKACPESLVPPRFFAIYPNECKDKKIAQKILLGEQKELDKIAYLWGDKALLQPKWFNKMRELGLCSMGELGFFELARSNREVEFHQHVAERFMVVYTSFAAAKRKAERTYTPYEIAIIEVRIPQAKSTEVLKPQVLMGIGTVFLTGDIPLEHILTIHTNDECIHEVFKKWDWKTKVQALNTPTQFSVE